MPLNSSSIAIPKKNARRRKQALNFTSPSPAVCSANLPLKIFVGLVD
jgi:hypothetical protein